MIDHAGWHSLPPKFGAGLRMPEQICQLSILPALARFSRPVLDQIDRGDVCKIVLDGLIEKGEGLNTVGVSVERPLG